MRALPSLCAWSRASSSTLYGILSVVSSLGFIVLATAASHDTALLNQHRAFVCNLHM